MPVAQAQVEPAPEEIEALIEEPLAAQPAAPREKPVVLARPPATKPSDLIAARPQPVPKPKPAPESYTTVEVRRLGAAAEYPAPIPKEEFQDPGKASVPGTVEKISRPEETEGKSIPWYSVRVGYTDSKMRADILRDVLKEQGFITAETVSTADGTHYVSLGDYGYRYQAEQVAESVKEKTGLIPQVYEKTVAK